MDLRFRGHLYESLVQIDNFCGQTRLRIVSDVVMRFRRWCVGGDGVLLVFVVVEVREVVYFLRNLLLVLSVAIIAIMSVVSEGGVGV